MVVEAVNGTLALTPDAIVARARAAGEPAFLIERRVQALQHFLATPAPGKRDEVWRRVDLGNFTAEAALPAVDAPRYTTLSPAPANALFVTLDVAAKSAPALLLKHWATQVFPVGRNEMPYGDGGKFHALNQALADGGYVYHVPENTNVAEPVRAEMRTRPGRQGIFPHNLIVLDAGAQATVIETYASPEGSQGFCNPQTEIVLGPGAQLRYILIQNTGAECVYIGAHRAHQYADSKLTFVSAHLGSKVAKAFLSTRMLEPRAHAYLSGLYYGTGQQKLHMDTLQHHVAPGCTTDLMFKGALDDKARAVYRGMIHLEPSAQKTDAYQQNRTLLLNDDARMDAIPGLEILANDVRCTHGATAGQVDPTYLFYLMSRGLTRFQARKMIMDGFFEEVVLRFGLEDVIASVRGLVDGKIKEE